LKKYEGLFILTQQMDDQALDEKLEKVRNEIVKLGGKVDATTRMGRNAFARPLKRKDAGTYVLMTFHLAEDKVAGLRERLRLNEDIFRAQIVQAAPPVVKKPVAAAAEAAAK
jgi:small subunit ribosomal protein S6